MKLILSLILLTSCASNEAKKNQAQCYLYLGVEAIKIETRDQEAYLFSYFNEGGSFYWEQLPFIERQYLPVTCSPKIIKDAQARLSGGN